jgi:disulfide bond formation protein DsbB
MPASDPAEIGRREPSTERAWTLLFAAWVVAAGSTLGALFFSEVMGIPPCVLCWYQRICLFPLAVLLPLGLFPFDPKIVRYTLPLAAIGAAVALFHVLLVHGVIPERITPCTQGVPCSQNPIEWFGFLGIPHLALVAFLIIIALLVNARSRTPK